MKALVTGAAGLADYYTCERFSETGCRVIPIDNFARRKLFGLGGDTSLNAKILREKHRIRVKQVDIRSKAITKPIRECDIIVDTASIEEAGMQLTSQGRMTMLNAALKAKCKRVGRVEALNQLEGPNGEMSKAATPS